MTVSQDATSLRYVPNDGAEWTELLAGSGIANPTALYLCQEASGNLADTLGGIGTLTKFSNWDYQQTITGWTRKAVKNFDGNSAFYNVSHVNLATTSVLIFGYVAITSAPGSTSRLVGVGSTGAGADMRFANVTTTPAYQAAGNGGQATATGSSNPSTTVRPVVMQVNRAASSFLIRTDQETIAPAYTAPSAGGSYIAFGPDGSGNPNAAFLYLAIWTGANAELDSTELDDLFDRLENGVPSAAPTLAFGTTLAALQAGSGSFKYTVAIEGYPEILTDATAQQAIDAWYDNIEAHGYESALPGLIVKLDNSQILNWTQPFTRGGNCSLVMTPDADDTFGADTAKDEDGATIETELTATIDRNDTTVAVKSMTASQTGVAYCGTEAFSYAGSTSTSFTGVTRGLYAPFARGGGDGIGFAEHHRVGTGPLQVLLKPRVTDVPTKWIGKWVGVWLHKFDASIPALNSRDDALCVFAGKIHAITDDPATGATVVEVKHVLDCIADATVGGRDQWSGKIRNTIQLSAGMTFKMTDSYLDGSSFNSKTANVLTVEDIPVGANECQSGDYTPTEIHGILMAWLNSEKVNSRLYGTYSIGTHVPSDQTHHTDIYWTISGTDSGDVMGFTLEGPVVVLGRLGFHNQGASIPKVKNFDMGAVKVSNQVGGDFRSKLSEDPIYLYVAQTDITQGGILRSRVDDATGTFQDQFDTLPSSIKPPATAGDGYGIFEVDGKFLMWGYVDDDVFIYDPQILPEQYGLGTEFPDTLKRIPWRKDGPEYVTIKQIAVIETSLQQFILKAFLSTGTAGYNDDTYDTMPYGIGLGIPREICGDAFLNSTAALPHPDKPIVALIDKTTKFSELLGGELVLRRAFLRWNEGGLEFGTWRSPTDGDDVTILDEDNKAAPAGQIDHQRSVSTKDGAWAIPTVKIQYNRSLKASPNGADGYRDSLTIVDSASLDDMGGDGPTLTINCRGTFGDFATTGSDANSLAGNFMASMPFFSRPARKSSRSIDQRYYEGLPIGSIVAWTDAYARDPSTGARGVATRYGIVIRHRYSLGGPNANSDNVDPQGGEVDLLFFGANRVAAYVPTADVDDTQTNGGYTDATKTLICYAHHNSESSETVDIGRFAADDEIRIIEIDPADPASPLLWERTVVSVNTGTNSVVLDTALSSPAWDATKKYRIVFNDYSIVQTSQQLKCFQADDTDGKVLNLRVPYEYGVGGGDSAYTQWSADDPVELPPDASFGDGQGRDVGHEVALARLLNNLYSYKTSVSSPVLLNAEADPTPVNFGGGTYWCIQCRPVFLGADIHLNDIYRNVSIAPHFASLAGASAKCRVTLSRTPPKGEDWIDVDRGSIIASNEWTTTSTTYSTPTPVEISAKVKDNEGVAWLYVEITGAAKSWGLAHLQVTSIRRLFSIVTI